MIEVGSKWRETGEESVVEVVQVMASGRVVFKDETGKLDGTDKGAFLKYFERVEE